MISVQIRRATREDIAGIRALRTEQMIEQGEPDESRDFAQRIEQWYFGHDASGPDKAHWVAIAGIEIVGVLSLLSVERTPKPIDKDTQIGIIDNLYVHEEWRELGIGSRLASKGMRYARAKGYSKLLVGVDVRSASLFTRAGFDYSDELMLLELEGFSDL